ncbi:hypothetical protein L6452_04796 [Arctium lappa]|uniref:Uncharacterized protein n=1 Tax=Arctium lappa TaxID=4217 RepID=A0ACB9EEM5_ARCLA|nr:hypothetical protein L6452_04796 [Arctium lappa]
MRSPVGTSGGSGGGGGGGGGGEREGGGNWLKSSNIATESDISCLRSIKESLQDPFHDIYLPPGILTT